MDENRTYSILIRLRRTTTEDAFIRVPVVGDLMLPEVDEHGHHHIDSTKLVAAATRLAQEASVRWVRDGEPMIEPHPIQTPLPEGR